MRWRSVALISLGVNVVLAAGWMISAHYSAQSLSVVPAPASGTAAATNHPTLVVRRQFFSWQEVESPDYPTYITNLRDIGCPEQTIRDIIIADVNSLFARRRATELLTSDQQWWRSEPDTNVVQAAAEKARALEDERRGLLARLLGTNWESGDLATLPRPSRPGIALDGPVLGTLPTETKQAIQDISVRSQDRMQAYLDAQRAQGKEPDPVELGRLRQQTRDELARVLAPSQLDEFLLRYSQTANNLRSQFGELRFFNATPEEFRAIFHATDVMEQRLESYAGDDPNMVAQRKALEDERENAIKNALGPKRYAEYRLLQDPLYRQAVATAQQAGTPESAGTIYAINVAAASQQASITGDTNLTTNQKLIEMQRLQLEQLQANTIASGLDLPPEPPSLPPTPPRRTYVIHPGDNLAVVSLMYGIPAAAIRQVNPKVDFNRLKPGDAINLPGPAVPPPPGP